MGVRAGRGIRVLRAHLPLLLAAAVSVIAFFATSPTALFEWNLLMEGLQNGTDTFSFSGLQLDNLSHYLGYFMFRGGLGDLLTLLALLGMAVAILRHRALDLVAIAFPITYFVLILFGSAEMVRIRMALPLTPFLALFAALGLFTLAEILAARSRRFADWQPAALALVTVALLAGPGFKTWQDDNGMARPTNRALATAWAQTNLPAGARVVSTEDGIYLNPPLIQAKPIASLQAVQLNDLRQVGADYVVATENPTEKPAVDPALTLVQSFGDESGTQGVVRIYSLPPLPLPLTLIDGSFEHERYAPNQAATLTLHWQALAPLMENYVEFIRLTHSATGASFETSGKPQAANGNTKRWPVGKIVTDTHRVDLPPEVAPGLYQVEVGFYREGTEYAMGLHAGAGTVYRSLPIGFVRIAPPPAPAGVPQERLEANFDHAIQLSGYTVSTSRPAPGTVLRLDLFWSASSAPPVTGNYARFVHLVDSQGRLIAQRDGVPCEGACPPGVWLPGETFQDGVGIELPADAKPGRYRLIVGWYDYPTMRRLSTDAGQDAIELTTVEVEP